MSTIPGKSPAVKMPPQIESARDLLLELMGKLLTVEETLARLVLPELVQEIQDDELKRLVQDHLTETRAHAGRIREAFEALGERPAGRPALGLDALRTETKTLTPDVVPGMRAGVLCTSAMGTERYEINAYESALRLAEALGEGGAVEPLRANLADERAAVEKLTQQAERLAHLAVEQRTAAN
jgi:ferritin-like metal-binding protein YciE